MDPTLDRTFNSLAEEILGSPLPPGLADMVPLPDLSPRRCAACHLTGGRRHG